MMNDEARLLAEVLLGEEVVPKNLQYFNKPPLLGSATPPHQDGYYFMIEPCSALTMWLSLDAVDEENGCIRYLRRSHKKGMRLHNRTQTLGFSQGITDFGTKDDIANEIVCCAKPGDLLVHQAMTVHRADSNNSISRNRRALGFIFYGSSAKENIEAHQGNQHVAGPKQFLDHATGDQHVAREPMLSLQTNQKCKKGFRETFRDSVCLSPRLFDKNNELQILLATPY